MSHIQYQLHFNCICSSFAIILVTECNMNQGRSIKDAGFKTALLILNIKHKVSLIPNGHNVWTIQIEYGISTILYGSYNS